MTFSKSILLFFLCLSAHSIKALEIRDSVSNKKAKYVAFSEFHVIYTTHSNTIAGFSLTVDRYVTPRLLAGVGTEISYSHFISSHDAHFDLFSFHAIPVFADLKYLVRQRKAIYFLDLAPGIDFIHYRKDEFKKGQFQISQQGFYAYAGMGALFKLTDYIGVSSQVGFKGYHFSSNQYEINPHGFVMRVGVTLHIPTF